MSEKETRVIENVSVELREGGEGESPTIAGVALVYDAWSHDLGGFRERFRPGAFGNLSGANVIANAHHETGSGTVARTMVPFRDKDGNLIPGALSLSNSGKRLAYEFNPANTSVARDLIEQVRTGITAGSSFTFRVKAGGQEIDEDDDGNVRRTITSAELFEVSPVVNPAYPQTSVDTRALDEYRAAKQAAEGEDAPTAASVAAARDRELALQKMRASV